MTRFIVAHRLPDMATQDQVLAVGRATLARLSDQARWLRSWVIPADNRFLCEWEASDEEAIWAALEGMDLFPVEAIHLAEPIDLAWFVV